MCDTAAYGLLEELWPGSLLLLTFLIWVFWDSHPLLLLSWCLNLWAQAFSITKGQSAIPHLHTHTYTLDIHVLAPWSERTVYEGSENGTKIPRDFSFCVSNLYLPRFLCRFYYNGALFSSLMQHRRFSYWIRSWHQPVLCSHNILNPQSNKWRVSSSDATFSVENSHPLDSLVTFFPGKISKEDVCVWDSDSLFGAHCCGTNFKCMKAFRRG